MNRPVKLFFVPRGRFLRYKHNTQEPSPGIIIGVKLIFCQLEFILLFSPTSRHRPRALGGSLYLRSYRLGLPGVFRKIERS